MTVEGTPETDCLSDVAGCPVHPGFSYKIVQSATCRPTRSSVQRVVHRQGLTDWLALWGGPPHEPGQAGGPLDAFPGADTAMRQMPSATPICYAQRMALSDRQLLDALSLTPFVDSTELALILGEPHATAHLPSSQRYHLTAQGIGEAARVLGFATPSDFVRAYPMSREWLRLLIRRMDAVAAVYRIGASMSPGIDGLRSRVEFHRRGRFDATITLHDGRSFGVVPPGPCAAATVTLRPAEGHSAVRPRAPSRNRPDPDAQRMGAAADGAVLHQH